MTKISFNFFGNNEKYVRLNGQPLTPSKGKISRFVAESPSTTPMKAIERESAFFFD